MDKYQLVVLFGGRSAEHDVSCVSARHVLGAADLERYEIIPVGIDREGNWSLSTSAVRALEDGVLPDALDPSGSSWDPLPELKRLSQSGSVVVFPLLHGPLGEDGTVQGLLEVADVPYVGSGVLSSSLAMDKLVAKDILNHHGIRQARHRGFHSDDLPVQGSEGANALYSSLLEDLGPKVFVKPANLGSSIGVSVANDVAELENALGVAASYDEWILVEEAISGREIELAVLGDRVPQVSGPGEIRPGAEFYDYADKYEDGSAELIDNPDLDSEVVVSLQQNAAKAFTVLRCSGMARVDFFVSENDEIILNEVNTIPGFTPISMYPRLWEKSGLSYSNLIDRLVDLGLQRYARQRHKTIR
jgi:D-alanine-D-alanine ligase